MSAAPATKQWIIYALADPRSNEVGYVGWTCNIKLRAANHVQEARQGKRTHKNNWLRALLADGVTPRVLILERGTGSGWDEAERLWIRRKRADGCALTNATLGGEGAPGRVTSPATKEKMATSNRGQKRSAEARARMSVAHLGKTQSPEVVANRTAKLRGRTRPRLVKAPPLSADHLAKFHSPEARAKAANARRGRIISAETRAKIGASNAGQKRSIAALQNQRAAHLGKTLTIEHRQHISDALRLRDPEIYQRAAAKRRGRKPSEETRAKIAAAKRGKPRPPGLMEAMRARITPESIKKIGETKRLRAAQRRLS